MMFSLFEDNRVFPQYQLKHKLSLIKMFLTSLKIIEFFRNTNGKNKLSPVMMFRTSLKVIQFFLNTY